MKKLITWAMAAVTAISMTAQDKNGGYPITQVPFTKVKVAPNTFWGQRLQASQDVTIPLAFSKSEETGRYTNFSNAAEHLKDPSKVFAIKEGTFSFDDTDPYKTIEGASYLLQTYPNAKFKGGRLDKYVDSVIAVIASSAGNGWKTSPMSSTISVTSAKLLWLTIMLQARRISSTLPSSMRIVYVEKWVISPVRPVWCLGTRLLRWAWQSFTLPLATGNTSIKPSSSSTSVASVMPHGR